MRRIGSGALFAIGLCLSAPARADQADPTTIAHCVRLALDPTLQCAGTSAEPPRARCVAKACAPVLPPGACRQAMLTASDDLTAAQAICERWLIAQDPIIAATMPRGIAFFWLMRRAVYPRLDLPRPALASVLEPAFITWFDPASATVQVLGRIINESGRVKGREQRVGVVNMMAQWLVPLRFR